MRTQRINVCLSLVFAAGLFGLLAFFFPNSLAGRTAIAQTTPTPASFDQAAALAALRESIKGREQEPAEKVFKNIQSLKGMPARSVLGIMQMGFSRSLGVDCTHCHTPGKWEAEDKSQKQIARDMWAMVLQLNGTTFKSMKNLKSPNPTVNCTTCHRGEIKPALNLPPKI